MGRHLDLVLTEMRRQDARGVPPSGTQCTEWASRIEALVHADRQRHEEIVELRPWKAVIIEALVVDWLLLPEHETDPKRALMDLVTWEIHCALDPAISIEARTLRDTFREDCLWLLDLVLSEVSLDVAGLRERCHAIREKLTAS